MKILITPRSFAKDDPAPLELLQNHGLVLIRNDRGRILKENELEELIGDCVGVIIGVDPLSAKVMMKAPALRAVAKYGVGLDNIDLAYCEKERIAVSRTVGANSTAVADYAFALILALARRVVEIDQKCRKGDWSKLTGYDVTGKTLGLIGLGAIGKEMVSRAHGFGMKVIAHDLNWDSDYANSEGIDKADLDQLCRESDFISLHLPLNSATRSLIGEREINLMKKTAFIINTARGGLVDEDALLSALQSRRVAGAGIDTFSVEPPENDAWFHLDNVVLGSHCAASTIGAANAMSMMAAQNLINDLGLTKEV